MSLPKNALIPDAEKGCNKAQNLDNRDWRNQGNSSCETQDALPKWKYTRIKG
tara:strand:+ start:235 stop:390 length:156 start_codon:yes stop_codon:yes gene_type:complete